jgi:hypothetical protein
MERKDFFKKACLYGICSCTGLSLNAGSDAFAAVNTTKDEPDWKIGFVQARFSKLIEILDSTVDSETKSKILENLGRACSSQSSENYKKFIGDVDGFLADLQKNWAQKASYDKSKNEITIIGKKTDNCFCPFVDIKKMSKDFCNCTLGWQKQTFETILGQKVSVRIDSTVLRGGESCNFTINVL